MNLSQNPTEIGRNRYYYYFETNPLFPRVPPNDYWSNANSYYPISRFRSPQVIPRNRIESVDVINTSVPPPPSNNHDNGNIEPSSFSNRNVEESRNNNPFKRRRSKRNIKDEDYVDEDVERVGDRIGTASYSVKNLKGKRYRWTRQEMKNLEEGVRIYGDKWRIIIDRYQFHHSRNVNSIAKKYKCMKQNQKSKNGCGEGYRLLWWSEEEERNLKRGVKKYGCNWRKILKSYPFNDRTENALMKKYKRMIKL